jgi:TRAP-type C4-dicarboxylate transport system permease large subunit
VALVTPPVGMNLFVIHHITEGKYYADIVKGIIPFLLCMFLMIVMLVLFPEIALWLPNRMF